MHLSPSFRCFLKGQKGNGGFEPFLVMSLDAVCKLTMLLLLWEGRTRARVLSLQLFLNAWVRIKCNSIGSHIGT